MSADDLISSLVDMLKICGCFAGIIIIFDVVCLIVKVISFYIRHFGKDMIDAVELKARINELYCKHADNIDFKNCTYQVERIMEDMRLRGSR